MKMGLGTVQLGLPYGIANKSGMPEQQESLDILNYAWQNGITWFDTASSYGASEAVLGQFVQAKGIRNQIQICTKLKALAKKNSDPLISIVQSEIKKSIANLRVPYIQWYMLHSAHDLFLWGQEIIDALAYCKKMGFVKHIGVSVYTKEDVLECLKYSEIDAIQIPFNILDQRLLQDGTLQTARDHGIQIHARSIYLQGLLTMNDVDLPSNLSETAPFLKYLDYWAAIAGVSRQALVFLYVRDHPLIDRFFIGCESIKQLGDNIKLYHLNELKKEYWAKLINSMPFVPESIVNPTLWRD